MEKVSRKELEKIILREIKSRKSRKDAITSIKLAHEIWVQKSSDVSPPTIRGIVRKLVMNGNRCICSCKEGYYYSTRKKDKQETYYGLINRAAQMVRRAVRIFKDKDINDVFQDLEEAYDILEVEAEYKKVLIEF